MKKIFMSAIFLMAVLLITASMASAQVWTANDAANDDVRITMATDDFTWDSSPNVSIGAYTTDFSYAILCTNILTDDDSGYDFGTVSTATGYAQRVKVTAQGANVTALTADTLSGTWEWVGGSGS